MLPPSLPDSVDWSQPVNWNHPLNWGLRAWWIAAPRFRGGVTWRDLCGRNHGTLTNMTPATAWQASSRPGGWGALALDGVNDYVDCGVDAVVMGPAKTASIGCWLRTTQTGNDRNLVCEGNSGSFDPVFALMNQNGVARVFFRTINSVDVSGTATINDGQDHFLMAAVDGTNLRIYVDGELDAGPASVASPAVVGGTFNTATIGALRRTSVQYYSAAQLGMVIKFGRALSATEVRSLYNLSRQHYPGLLNRVELPWYAAQPAAGGSGTILPFMQHLCMGRAE